MARLRDASGSGMHALLRRCALAVLTSGSMSDDPRAMLELYPDFDIQVLQQDRGIKIELTHAPAQAFVDGQIIRGINELLVAVVRDIVYVSTQLEQAGSDLDDSVGLTHAVFEILRNARILKPQIDPNLVVCWGGHSISRDEYDYTKQVGYQLGLRGMDICTGCGPGAMKGPMKGATIAHAKQRRRNNRYIGITEPGIIAAESPNPIVNQLVIMPDIEKRLEAFVRMGHGIIVFPGGVGTAEEILYLLGILLHPDNAGRAVPADLHRSARVGGVLRADRPLPAPDPGRRRWRSTTRSSWTIRRRWRGRWSRASTRCATTAWTTRTRSSSTGRSTFRWRSRCRSARPTRPCARWQIHRDRPRARAGGRPASRVFRHRRRQREGRGRARDRASIGPFEIDGEPDIMRALDELLQAFVAQHRMKLPGGTAYEPCYRVRAELN